MRRIALLLCLSPFAFAQDIDLPHSLSNSSVADADQVMANFNALKDGVNSRVSVDLTNYNLVIGNGLQSGTTPGNAYNTASGVNALYANTEGGENTASGSQALYSNTEGDYNTASGSFALYSNTTGGSNTASGFDALYGNTTGISNTASGIYALSSNTAGNANTASGADALISNTTGSYNTAVGFQADVASGNLQNATAIGYNAKVDASNKIQLGNTVVTSVATSGKLTTGTVTYPNAHGTDGQVLGTTGSGELVWLNSSQIVASRTQELEEQVASLQEQLKSQQHELLAIVQSQQEQIAQLQRMVEHQFAVN